MTPMTPHGPNRSNAIVSNLIPLSKKYKRAHIFKQQVKRIFKKENIFRLEISLEIKRFAFELGDIKQRAVRSL